MVAKPKYLRRNHVALMYSGVRCGTVAGKNRSNRVALTSSLPTWAGSLLLFPRRPQGPRAQRTLKLKGLPPGPGISPKTVLQNTPGPSSLPLTKPQNPPLLEPPFSCRHPPPHTPPSPPTPPTRFREPQFSSPSLPPIPETINPSLGSHPTPGAPLFTVNPHSQQSPLQVNEPPC